MAQQRFYGISPGGEILPEQGGEVIQPCADVKGNPGNDGRLDVKVFMAEKEGVILIGPAVDEAVRLCAEHRFSTYSLFSLQKSVSCRGRVK